MPVNLDKPQWWKDDIAQSVDMYNRWFTEFAPKAFRASRKNATRDVKATLEATDYLTNLEPAVIRQSPGMLSTLRMSTCPPLAVDRLIGLAGLPPSMVKRMEKLKKLPVRLKGHELDVELRKIGAIISKMADPDIFVWMNRQKPPTRVEIHRAATIVADRLSGAVANPVIRNAQEQRQLAYIAAWLDSRDYSPLPNKSEVSFREMPPGTFSLRMNVVVDADGAGNTINMPIDAVIMRKTAKDGDFPLFVEAKSAGDHANTNKRRKEEAQKIKQLRDTYGPDIEFVLFLCGYFDSGYLGYEAAEGIDWVWEHRIDDFEEMAL